MPAPSVADKLRRLAWKVVESTLYRWSPLPCHRWRCLLLRTFGARVESPSYPYPSVRIWAPWNLELRAGSCLGANVNCYSVAPVILEADALVSQGAHLCTATHDHRSPHFTLMAGPIRIGERAWIAADAFIGPGVRVACRAVVGARAVVNKDVDENAIVVGNPARRVSTR
jgi:putative colanic acid biosynthesis acetyltransferase WcaF